MKIIFLDFDGVLNCETTKEKFHDRGFLHMGLDHRKIDLLNKLVEATGAKVVVSSSWRLIYPGRTAEILREFGFTGETIDETPNPMTRLFASKRMTCINAWFELNGYPTNWVILDDDTSIPRHAHLVRVDEREGLTDQDVAKAISVLTEGAERE